MTPLDFILDQMRLVVVDLYADFIQVERVANDDCLDIEISSYSCASTEIDGVLLDTWPTLFALYIDSVGVT